MRIARFFRRRVEDQELTQEIEAHLAQETDDNVARGMSREEARRRALIKFGSRRNVREDLWEWNSVQVLDQWFRDLRYAVRRMLRAPGFALAVILVMGLGIGANTALFTIVRSVLLKPLPFKEPDRLLRLYEHSADDKFPYNVVSGGVFAEWKKHSHGFSDLAILGSFGQYSLSGGSGQLPEKARASDCSWNLFDTLGVEPTLGRSFTASDDQRSANGTVVLSWGLWKRRFGGDPAILNQTIRLDEKPYTVIGIMPAWFAYPEQSIQLWTPIYHEEDAETMQAMDSHNFLAVGRLKPGVCEKEARAELSVIVRSLHDAHLENPFISKAADTRPLIEDIVGDVKAPLYMLLAATACLLLIGCLNVASLFVARRAARAKELAIRTALGGSGWRLVREHLSESLLLSVAGGGLGLLLAYSIVQWVISSRGDLARVEAVRMDSIAIAFAFGLILLCGAFAGITSLLSFNREKALAALQETSRSNTAGHGRANFRRVLLAAEVGLTVVLLVGSGLLLKGYALLRSTSLGCITDNVLTMRFNLTEQYSKPEQRTHFFETFLERVRALPGVQAAGLIRAVPGQGYGGDNGFAITEHPPLAIGQIQYALNRWADPGYFAALGIPFLRGETFSANQRLENVNEMIISEALARQYFPGEDPIGKHLETFGRRKFKIVGIVGDTRFLVAQRPQPMMYFSIYSGMTNDATLAVRSSRDVTALALPIQQIFSELDPELALADILTMDQLVGKSTLDASFNATLVLAFAVLSLVLAAVGLYGVMSYLVAQRTSEIGVRMALGAQPVAVLHLMLAQGLRPAGVGLLLGLAGGAAAADLIRGLLYGVRPFDWSVFVGVAGLLLATAALACVMPAWRASRLDPVRALRVE
jgi:predicted permease